MDIITKLEKVVKRYEALSLDLSNPAVLSNKDKYKTLCKEHSDLKTIVETYDKYKKVIQEIDQSKELSSSTDMELRALAQQEYEELAVKKQKLEEELKRLLVPKHPFDDKNIYLEIRAGTGGDEAALFAADLFRMYSKYAEKKGWKIEMVESSPTGQGGYKEIISLVVGRGAYGELKYEAGVHRVQRVPATEAQGRIHTSASTVAVLPEAEDVELDIKEKDLRIDVYRSSGHGGQSVNTTDSAVRITHLPTGIVVAMQDEKSQHKNKAKALKILKSRILAYEMQKQQDEISSARKDMVGSGDRSEKIRTYNFPQNRITDHRINLTLHKLDKVINGDLAEIIVALQYDEQQKALLKSHENEEENKKDKKEEK